ncbi:cytochrome c3 family protein [Shewanella aestuarii]|uniref:Cytochrome c3 family protein n=1 Tax=Shewanella aestuarii TaxID=1028752 RepID=A0A6G9QP65_9GAMM|nr:cytochrome c3 family protein [Shewanella aestuarii]QIR15629.1 cytochrome c3 family protein [Shewanella aestuarii]
MKKLTLRHIMLTLALGFFANTATADSTSLLDQTHAAKGVKCASCHGKAETREPVTMMKCVKCHNTEKLAKQTKDFKPTNPHDNRHFGTETDCANCHKVHEKSENYCSGCHVRFDFVVP